jgi:endonuclease/exonuclease/phosphatase family metal-dependent hydrolase
MNERFLRPVSQLHVKLVCCAGLVASLALIIETGGCASRRPAPLVIEYPSVRAPVLNAERGLSLKLVTYNIWGLPSWMTGARSGRYPQIARELERLDPDIILLQEAWTAQARKSAPANGHWAIARAAGQHTFFQQSGLMTLSRFPILGGEFFPFSRRAFPDRLVNKGVLKVTLRLPGGLVLNVWNVHLQDGGPPEIHRSQVRELVSRVQAAVDGQVADLVGGDFNCTPDSPSCGELVSSLGPSVQQLGGAGPFVTWDGLSRETGVGQTLDHIFIRARRPFLELRATPSVAFAAASQEHRLSDHFGIEARVNLGPEAGLSEALDPPPESGPGWSIAAGRSVLAGRQ